MAVKELNIRRKRPYYLWDYDISFDEFKQLLDGSKVFGRLDRDWAAVRLIEYAPYEEMIRLVGYPALVREWPTWRERVRMEEIKRGLDFLVTWLPQNHPELLEDKPVASRFGHITNPHGDKSPCKKQRPTACV